MYQRIYEAYCRLGKGDQAELKRCNLKKLANATAYFRVLKMTGLQDTQQTQRILFLLMGIDVADDEQQARSVAEALIHAGIKEQHVIQISRSGENGIEYLKRQLIRCKQLNLNSIGKLAQYWGDNARRSLLKDFILNTKLFL